MPVRQTASTPAPTIHAPRRPTSARSNVRSQARPLPWHHARSQGLAVPHAFSGSQQAGSLIVGKPRLPFPTELVEGQIFYFAFARLGPKTIFFFGVGNTARFRLLFNVCRAPREFLQRGFIDAGDFPSIARPLNGQIQFCQPSRHTGVKNPSKK